MLRRTIAVAVIAAVVGLAACGSAPPPPAPAIDPGPSAGMTDPAEIIEARRVLMLEAERQMNPIDEFTLGTPADLAALRSSAVTLEALLLALPHLFPQSSNLYDPNPRETPTIALPAIWENFDAFLAIAETAEMAAAAIAAAQDAEPLKAAARDLRAACDACHAAYTRPYVPPKVTQEDLEFDFEPFLPQ